MDRYAAYRFRRPPCPRRRVDATETYQQIIEELRKQERATAVSYRKKAPVRNATFRICWTDYIHRRKGDRLRYLCNSQAH